MLTDAGAPPVLAHAPLAVVLADAAAPTVLVFAPAVEICRLNLEIHDDDEKVSPL